MTAKVLSALAGLVVTTVIAIAGNANVSALEVNSLSINISENPTKNTNIFGTTFDALGDVQSWGSNYMMIRLKLSSVPDFYAVHLYLDAFANKGNQNTDPANGLRYAIFDQDPIANSLSDKAALARTTINQALISPTFTDYLMGPAYWDGTLTSTPTDYYFMIYAGGAIANNGYGLKVDRDFPVITYYAPDATTPPTVEYFNGTTFTGATSQPPGGIPVPEPSAYILGTLAVLIMVSLAKDRKRLAPAG